MGSPETRPGLVSAFEPGWQILPGYRVWSMNGNPYALDSGDRQIVLTNRSFQQVDEILHKLPSEEIERRVASGRVPISVLDIGGGYNSRAAIDMSWTYWRDVSVTNLDIIHGGKTQRLEKVTRVLGDVSDIPLPDACFDVAYATYVLAYLPGEKVEVAISEVSRVLRPGGVAFLLGEIYREYAINQEALRVLFGKFGIEPTNYEISDDRLIAFQKPQP